MDSFTSFGFAPAIQKAIDESGHQQPTPIQVQAIPIILGRKDLIGIAQTGTGKTAAFALPILHTLHTRRRTTTASTAGAPLVLVLAPSRELAQQIARNFEEYGAQLDVRVAVLFGGVPQDAQVRALRRGVDIVVATPGRLLDLTRQKLVVLGQVRVLVLDEADRMLDMGFAEDIKLVLRQVPHKRQTLLFSATMSEGVKKLAHSYLHQPLEVSVTAQATTAKKAKQSVLYVDREDRFLLLKLLIAEPHFRRVLVFTQMKHVADKLALRLRASGVAADALHSDRTQAMRTQALADFKEGKTRVLVATDIAARGLDIEGVTHVINYEVPLQAEAYVHRIGRTARAGAEGTALTFCSAGERAQLHAIELLIGKKLTVRAHKYHSAHAQSGVRPAVAPTTKKKPKIATHKARGKTGWKQK
jgi:ATP-dependent RNA helicase RhlE